VSPAPLIEALVGDSEAVLKRLLKRFGERFDLDSRENSIKS
jgi:hypothetical protein